MDLVDVDGWQLEAGLGPDPASVRELLVVRSGGIASAVHAVPALRHLRHTYPGARITVAVDPPARELVQACPFVDEVVDIAAMVRTRGAAAHTWDLAVSFASPEEVRGARSDARPAGARSSREGAVARADLLDLGGVPHRSGAAWRAREDVAARGRGVRPVWPDRLSNAGRMLRLAWLLGGEAPSTSFALWPSLADRNGAAALMTDESRPLAIVHAGASGDTEFWHLDGWARVLDLVASLGLRAVLVGGAADIATGAIVVRHARVDVLDLCGATTIGELVGLIERSALFVGGDSGPAVLAEVLGVRSVVVGPRSLLEHSGGQGRVDLVTAGPCLQCGEICCEHPLPPVAAISEEAVLGQVAVAAEDAMRRWRAQRVA